MSTEIKLNPATEEMSAKIREALVVSVQGDAGDVTGSDNIYESLLPVDLPMDLVKRVNAHNELFIAAAWDATGDAARAAAVDNAGLKTVNASFPMGGRNKVDAQWNRSEERNAGIPKKGEVAEKKTVYGAMSGKVTIAGTDPGNGELNKVVRRQKQAAADMFGTVSA